MSTKILVFLVFLISNYACLPTLEQVTSNIYKYTHVYVNATELQNLIADMKMFGE